MPSEVRFNKVKKTLKEKGYYLDRVSGSHHIFEKNDGSKSISIPVHKNKVKPCYVKDIEKL